MLLYFYSCDARACNVVMIVILVYRNANATGTHIILKSRHTDFKCNSGL